MQRVRLEPEAPLRPALDRAAWRHCNHRFTGGQQFIAEHLPVDQSFLTQRLDQIRLQHVRAARNDFVRPEAPWLVAVFTSSMCDTCAGVWERAELLTSDQVATQRIDFQTDKALHERYNIDGVPTLVVADADGAVKRGFLGPVTATDLWAAVADEREPGSVSPGCHTGELDDQPS